MQLRSGKTINHFPVISTEASKKKNAEKRLSKDEYIAILHKEVNACNQMSDRLRKIYGPNVKDSFVKEKKLEIFIGIYHFINNHQYIIETDPNNLIFLFYTN
jgi:hypothetical protein